MGPLDDPRLWFEQYGHNIWEIARSTGEPAVARAAGGAIEKPTLFGFRGVMVERDAQLGALARAILIRRPGLWARWFFAAIGYGLDQLPDDLWLVTPLWLLLLSVPFAAWHVELGGRRAVRPGALSQAERRARLMGLAMVGVSYFAVYLALVCLVSFPFDRYLTSMTLFLPGIGCALVLEAWRSVVAPEVKSHRA